MVVESVKSVRERLLASTWTWWILVAVYAGVVVIVLAPVLLASVGADDSHWILEQGPDAGGSVWQAFWGPLSHAFDFNGLQARTTALAFSERQVLALLTMRISILFAMPPMIVWALVKVALFGLSIVAVATFLREVRFRDRLGTLRSLEKGSIAFIAIALPLAIAIGAKSQNAGTTSLNGWNYYPTLTYGAFVTEMFFAALVLRLSTLLQRDFRRWVAPAVVIMVISSVIINLSYEVLALIVPISVLVLLIQPSPSAPTLRSRWKAKLTILLALGVPFTALFVWIRWSISQMACQASDTCYAGSDIQVKGVTLWRNFFGAFPGHNAAVVRQQAHSSGVPFPEPGASSIALGIIGAIAMLALWKSWNVRHPSTETGEAGAGAADDRSSDTRGLWGVAVLGLAIAVGSAVITGITARAVDYLDSPLVSYRTSVVTWSALALVGVVIVRILATTRWRAVRVGSVLALSAVLIGSVGLYLPRNVLSLQDARRSPTTQFIDELHREVAIGDTSRAGDQRRCDALRAEDGLKTTDGQPSGLSKFRLTVDAAYKAFEFYHHTAYCSTDLGHNLPAG